MSKLQVVVLGGTGFIGSHVAEQLLEAEYPVTALVRRHSPESDRLKYWGASVQIVDFGDEQALLQAFKGHTILVNCIAYVKVHASLEELNKVQVDLTLRVHYAALLAGISHHLMLSTVEVYGFRGPVTKQETNRYYPEFNFQYSCYAKEEAFIRLMEKTDCRYAILQPACTIGAYENGSSFFRELYQLHQQDSYPLISGGRAKVAVVDTRDIGLAMVWLADHSNITGEKFLLSGYDTTWLGIKEAIDNYRGITSQTRSVPYSLALTATQLTTALLPYRYSPRYTPLAIKLMGADVLIDDTKLRATGFSTQYHLSDSVANAIEDFG